MSVREAERDAAQLLSSSWWIDESRSVPIPVEPHRLARGLGIRVVEAPLPSDESGNIVIPDEGEVVITLNQFDHLNRRRFTCAHEIGHYIRHRERGGSSGQTMVDYRNTLAGMGVDSEEIYANQFAAALLMPSHLVERGRVRESLTSEDMARRFGTSTQALDLRLRNLGLQ